VNPAHALNPPLASHAVLSRLDKIIDSINHPVRRQIVMGLNFRRSMYAGEIASHYDCAWPTVSRHLKVLVKAGVVNVQRKGRQVAYSVNRKQLLYIWKDWLSHFEKGEH
jgi:DNA-binding transcriptional ArsR family regulator